MLSKDAAVPARPGAAPQPEQVLRAVRDKGDTHHQSQHGRSVTVHLLPSAEAARPRIKILCHPASASVTPSKRTGYLLRQRSSPCCPAANCSRPPAPAALAAAFRDDGEARVRAAGEAVQRHPAEAVAANEDYWRDVQSAFTLDRTIINLNNGGCCPSPRIVHDAFKRYLDISNQAPVYHMWQVLEPNIESVRRQLAAEFGCDAEELAITRNASEALQIAQLGVESARRRRSGHDQPGLRAHARHVGAARAPGRDQASRKSRFRYRRNRRTSSPIACSPRSRRRPASCTSATSRI